MAISSNFELINDNFQTFLHSLDHHFYFYDHQTYDNVVFFFLVFRYLIGQVNFKIEVSLFMNLDFFKEIIYSMFIMKIVLTQRIWIFRYMCI